MLIAAPSGGATTLTDWPQIGFDPTHTATNPFESILDPNTVADLGLAWQAELGGEGLFSAVVAGGMVFQTSYENGTVHAFDASTGTPLWTYRIAPNSLVQTPAVAGGRVFVSADTTAKLYALDQATGALDWTTQMENSSSAPPAVVVDGDTTSVYASGGGTVYAVDGSDGTVLWQQSPYEPFAIQATPAVADGVVYVADDHPVVHAYDATTGTELWASRPLAPEITAPSYVVVDGDRLLVAPGGRALFALDPTDGHVLWREQIYAGSQPSVANGLAYIQRRKDSEIRLMALDDATGDRVWQQDLGSPRVYSFCDGASIANGVVYTTSLAGAVLAIDATTGEKLWRYAVPVGARTMPVVVNGMVYAAAGRWLFAFGLQSWDS
ncbi:MAG TPA: PQQ-binding-like beta-propeller repeat protein [Acidimicrobiales bacterium]